MKKLLIVGLLAVIAMLAAAPMTPAEQVKLRQLYQKTSYDLTSGNFEMAMQDIDEIYCSNFMMAAEPTLFISNQLLAAAALKYFDCPDPAAKAARLAAALHSMQAKTELYYAWARAAANAVELQPNARDLAQSITLAETEIKELDGKLAAGEIKQTDCDRQKLEIGDQIASLKEKIARQQTGPMANRATAVDQVLSLLLADQTLSDTFRHKLLVAVGTEYQRIIENAGERFTAGERQQSARRILQLMGDEEIDPADPMYFFILEMRLDALQVTDQSEAALQVAGTLLQTKRGANGPGRAMVLVKKGYILLSLKRYPEAEAIAKELKKTQINTEPLKTKIAAYLNICDMTVKPNLSN